MNATSNLQQPERVTALDRPEGAEWQVRCQRPGESVPDYVAFFRTRAEAEAYAAGDDVQPLCTRSCRP